MRYGNFCGPGPYDDVGFAKTPINAVDAACKSHDLAYRDCGLIGLDAIKAALPGSKNACVMPSDVTLVKDMDDITEDPSTPFVQKQVAKIIRNYFGLKTKLAQTKKPLLSKTDEAFVGFASWLNTNEGLDGNLSLAEKNFNNHGGDRSTHRALITRSKIKHVQPHFGPLYKKKNNLFKI